MLAWAVGSVALVALQQPTCPRLLQVFTCSICQEVFKRRMELRLHMVSHTGEMPYKVSSACRTLAREQRGERFCPGEPSACSELERALGRHRSCAGCASPGARAPGQSAAPPPRNRCRAGA